jgi:UDP-glucuronate decarboxylase
MIRAFYSLMNTPDDFTGPVNIGNPAEYTMLELAERVMALTMSSSRLEFLPKPSDDPIRRRPDITLAREKLGWEPKVCLEDGLVRTIDYFRQALSNELRSS